MKPEGPGLRCFACDARFSVIDSRQSGATIRRRRRCKVCGAKVTTFEIMLSPAHRNEVLVYAAALVLRDRKAGPSAAGQLSLDAALVGSDAEEAPFG
jgi:hypothetical protein